MVKWEICYLDGNKNLNYASVNGNNIFDALQTFQADMALSISINSENCNGPYKIMHCIAVDFVKED